MNNQLSNDVIQEIAAELGVNPAFIEKDWYVVKLIQALSEKEFEGLQTIGFIDSKDDVNFTDLKRFEYAYVIYDLKHRQNMDLITAYFKKQGVYLNERFGSFEYLNMDAIIQQSKDLAEHEINNDIG